MDRRVQVRLRYHHESQLLYYIVHRFGLGSSLELRFGVGRLGVNQSMLLNLDLCHDVRGEVVVNAKTLDCSTNISLSRRQRLEGPIAEW